MSRRYVTTTIPYVNAQPHLGFALELVQADAFVRYQRLAGGIVRFQTGTDDNALSNVLSARLEGVPVDAFVDHNSNAFRRLCDLLDIGYDRFLRTTEPAHHEAVRHFLTSLDAEDTYVAPYQGSYCPRCEDFYVPRDAPDGRCPEHAVELHEVDEVNHFFRLGRYETALRDLIERGRLEVVPESRRTEVLRFIESGLHDISISRSAARAEGWGVPYPGDPDQVVYVWIDALVNYLTGLGYPDGPDFDAFWTHGRKTHVIGKNVWKFHAVYWPALLLSAGLEVPDTVFAHGFLTEDGCKISKSAGTARDPADYVADFGSDAIRYYLLARARAYDDTDVSEEHIEAAYRSDLANTLGNLCSRLTALCAKAGVSGVSKQVAGEPPGDVDRHVRTFRFDLAASVLWAEFARLNREIAEERPWERLGAGEVRRSGSGDARQLEHGEVPHPPPSLLEHESEVVRRLRAWAEQLHGLAFWLSPLLPETAARIRTALSAPEIRRTKPLFPRRDGRRSGPDSPESPDSRYSFDRARGPSFAPPDPGGDRR